jgi:hypothetical protein
MNQYLDAVVAHDPKRMPAAPNLKFTENAVQLEPGDGFWRTATAINPKSRLYIADPRNGQIAFYGAATENGHGVLFSVRLKHVDRRITELETFVVRNNSPAVRGAYDNPPEIEAMWSEEVPVAERSSREELIRIANQYPEGLEQNSGDIVPFADTVTRFENGIKTAPHVPTPERPQRTIREDFNTSNYSYITDVGPRRYLVVDEERGIVYCLFFFNTQGTEIPDVFREAASRQYNVLTWPNSRMIMESFKIRDGKIVGIYAYLMMSTYRQPWGW